MLLVLDIYNKETTKQLKKSDKDYLKNELDYIYKSHKDPTTQKLNYIFWLHLASLVMLWNYYDCTYKTNVTADRDARRSDGSDKCEVVRQQGITEYYK